MGFERMYVYRTSPTKERKAQAELRRACVRAYVPQEEGFRVNRRRVRRVVAPGYVFAESAKPVGTTYVKDRLGSIKRAELAPLYAKRKAAALPLRARTFLINDEVTVMLNTGPLSGKIVKFLSSGATAIVETTGRSVRVSIKRLQIKS